MIMKEYIYVVHRFAENKTITFSSDLPLLSPRLSSRVGPPAQSPSPRGPIRPPPRGLNPPPPHTPPPRRHSRLSYEPLSPRSHHAVFCCMTEDLMISLSSWAGIHGGRYSKTLRVGWGVPDLCAVEAWIDLRCLRYYDRPITAFLGTIEVFDRRPVAVVAAIAGQGIPGRLGGCPCQRNYWRTGPTQKTARRPIE